MNDEVPQGQRFSHVYLRPDQLSSDSARLRARLVVAFHDAIGDSARDFGVYVERELGIRLLRQGTMGPYVPWDSIKSWELRDILDTITLVGRYLAPARTNAVDTFRRNVTRIFSEESASYRLDERCGVHPAVDAAYQASFDASIRGLGAARFEAARAHLRKADDELLPAGSAREAIRAVFDAVENIFKQTFPGTTHINQDAIRRHLRPLIERLHPDPTEKRATLKIADALTDWVDACHNYRHEPGHPEPTPPAPDLAVLVVSQGISYARWLAELLRKAAM